jgi:phosphoglycerol transferase
MIILSLFLFCLSLFYFVTNKVKWNMSILFYSFFVLLFILFTDIHFIFNYFTWKWLDNSVIYYFRYWWEWSGWFEYKKLIITSILSLLLILLVLYYFVQFYLKKSIEVWKKRNLYRKISYIIMIFSFLFHPLINNFLEMNWFYEISNSSFSNDLLFKDFYKVPQFKDIDKKKNIVYIYLESYEKLYLDEKLFPWLSPWLNNIKYNSTYFDNLFQAYWTSWTIAWMVGSQCWVPLEFPWNLGVWDTNKSYLKWAYCLWDYLKTAWYDLNYLWWAKSWFAGKWKFYKSHWFDNVSWSDEYKNNLLDKNYLYSWGLYDDTTFDIAYDKYEELSKIDKPFWLFMINMDTHWDTWVISKSCKDLKYNSDNGSILNSYHCTDYLVSNFIEKIKKLPNFKNTVVVIWSDHYAMDNNNSSDILKDNQDNRWLLFMIYDSDNTNNKIVNKKWDTLDIWATVLSHLWFPVQELWLWINLMNNNISRNPEIFLTKWIKDYQKFWK